MENSNPIRDAQSLWRKFPYALLLVSLIAFGFYPRLLTDKIKPTAESIVGMATTQTEHVEKVSAEKTLQAAVK